MTHIVKKCKLFHRSEKFVLILIVLFIIISSVMLPFVYGFNQNYLKEKNAGNPLLTTLQIEFGKAGQSSRHITKGRLEKCLFALPEAVHGKVINYFTETELDGLITAQCRFVIRGAQYGVCEVFRDNMLLQNRMKDYFTEEQEQQGHKVAFLYDNSKTGDETPALEQIKTDGGFIRLQGEEYQIIGTQTWLTDGILIPFASLREDTLLDGGFVNLSFSEPVTKRQYDAIKGTMTEHLGDLAEIPSYVTDLDAQRKTFCATLLLTGILALVMGVNSAALLQYILIRRKRELGICMLCGMSRRRAVFSCLAGYILLFLPSCLIGAALWHWLLLPGAGRLYPYLKEACTGKAYTGLFGMYLVISAAVLAASVLKYVLGKPIRALLGGRL